MKYLILTLIFSFASTITMNAQSQTPTTEQKQLLNPIVDDGFTQWGESWSYDTYISRSAKINKITIDEDYGDIVVYGTFSYKRLTTDEGTFMAKISRSGRLISIRYTDANGSKGSKTF
jgi:hypothetical protein